MNLDIKDLLETRRSPLIRQALTHRSFIRDKEMTASESNERLEFLGDSVLNLVITGELYGTYPDFLEGHLARLRSRIVSRKSLARAAERIGLHRHILVGKAAKAEGVQRRSSVVADALEAIFGAVFLEKGFKAAKELIINLMKEEIDDAVVHDTDFKSRLQEATAADMGVVPSYRVTEVKGPEHARRFKCEAILDGEPIGEGEGSTKKEAQQNAAEQALKKMGR